MFRIKDGFKNLPLIDAYMKRLEQLKADGNKFDRWSGDIFQVGDILDASFVYTSKHPALYVITRRTAKMIWVKALETEVVRDDGYGQNGEVMPTNDIVPNARELRAKITKRGSVSVNGSSACLWDGKPVDFYTD